MAEDSPAATFIEIGANDGDQEDHVKDFIRTSEWSGVMVEPVDYVYDRLAARYARNPRIQLERVVISDTDGTVPFYYLEPPAENERERLPSWYDGIGSLSREAVLSHRRHIPDIETRLRSEDLPSMTLESLCAKHRLESFDLLVLDTEGYDAQLLAQSDLGRFAPRIIIYEHFHLDSDARRACREMLGELGYETREEGFNTVCLRPSSGEALGRVWARYKVAVAGVYAQSQERG